LVGERLGKPGRSSFNPTSRNN